jgi:hypothetical protein
VVSKKETVGQEWDQVMFNDESRFCLWQNDHRVLVRRFSGERRNLEFTLQENGGVTPGVIVWDSIGTRSLSERQFKCESIYR